MNNQIIQPTIYQINTAVFLYEQSKKVGQTVTFDTVSDDVWNELAALPIDTVWFMGIWQRSPRSKEMNEHLDWLKEALPDATPDDVLGSAYSIKDYVVDERFGGDTALAVARQKLHERGIKVMLDFVPNHIAIDHPWVSEHPEYLLQGSEQELSEHPDSFVQTDTGIFANAKDPQYPAWSDVLQLNAFSEPLRQASIATLTRIATMCDMVRCDMAMLLLNDVFAGTWGERAGQAPEQDYWPEVIRAVKSGRPEFLFFAEVYWGREQQLIEQGFDFCYDKETYDALVKGDAKALKDHLKKVDSYQSHLLRFIENHDEPRAAQEFSLEQHKAAAAIALTLPGARLIHDGELEGRKIRIPVQLERRQVEPVDEAIATFYKEFLEQVKVAKIGVGGWQQEPVKTGLFGSNTHIFAWTWRNESSKTTIVVNYSAKPCKATLADKTHLTLAPWQYVIKTN